MNIGGCRSHRGIGIDIVPTDAEITSSLMQHEGRFEITERRKNRRLRARVRLKVYGFAALLKQGVELNLSIGRIDGVDASIRLRHRGPRRKRSKQDGQSRDCKAEFFHCRSGPLCVPGIKVDIRRAS